MHEQKSATNKIGLLQKFHEHKMGADDTAVKHVSTLMNMTGQLRDISVAVDEDTVMAKILAGLTPKFYLLCTAWESVEPARQTLNYLHERLIREDTRLAEDSDAATALAAMRFEKNEMKPHSPRKDTECFWCHKKGHFAH